MQQNEFRTELIINTDDDHPNLITNILGLEPSKIYVKGEQWYTPDENIPISGKINEYNQWIYTSKSIYSGIEDIIYLNHSVEILLNIMESKKEKLKDILKKYPSSYFGCYAYYYESHEYFNINSKILAKLNYYGIDVVFDVYNFSE